MKFAPAWITDAVPKGSAILDIGCGDGDMVKAYCDALGDDCLVIAVDPRSHTPKLDSLVKRHGPRVQHHRAVVGATPGDAIPFYEQGEQSSVWPGLTNQGHEIFVPRVTLDSLLPSRPIAAVKIDAQGAEMDILAGATRALGVVPLWILEAWPIGLHHAGSSVLALWRLMTDRGFRVLEKPNGTPVQEDVVVQWQTMTPPNPTYVDWWCIR